MNEFLMFGLFAWYVVLVSLYGILSGSSDSRLAQVRRSWGRIRGLSIYFCVHVVFPLLVGIVFVGWGAVNFKSAAAESSHQNVSGIILKIDWQAIQKLKEAAEKNAEPVVAPSIPLCA